MNDTVIIRAYETEKAAKSPGQTFVVEASASKTAVADSAFRLYGQKVKSVRLSRLPAKTRTVGRGRTFTKRKAFKKAIITFEKGPVDILSFKK